MKKKLLIVAVVACVAVGAFFAYDKFKPLAAPAEALPEHDDSIVGRFENLNQYLSVLTLTRQALAVYPNVVNALEIPVDADLPDICDRPVIVSIYRENTRPLWGVGEPNCLEKMGVGQRTGCVHDAVLCAAYQIAQQKAFQTSYAIKMDEVAVRVDVVDKIKRLKPQKNGEPDASIEPGVHGLMLQTQERATYQPPFSYIIYGWETDDRSRRGRTRRQLGYLTDDAGVGSWKRYPTYRFTTHAILQHRPDFMPFVILRDAPQIKRFGPQEIGRAAIDGGRYLDNTFDHGQKRFRYRFDPITVEKGGFLDYDTVHHAGAVYALFRLYKASHKDEFLDVGRGSLDFILRGLQPPLLEPELLAVKRMQVTQLGATALSLAALTELPDKMLSMIGIERISRLARFVVNMQEPDGRFFDYYWFRLLGYMPKKPVRPFQGEALYALAKYFKVNPNVEWLLAARRAAEWQIQQFELDGIADPWAVQGLVELYDIDPNPRYAEACLKMANGLLEKQYGSHRYKRDPYPDYRGGFATSRPPRTITTARRIEGLIAGHWLAYRLGKDTRPYAEAVMRGTHFLLQNQYRRDNTYYVNLPEETRGAFRNSPIDPVIEINTQQHAISALVAAYDVAYMLQTGNVPDEFQAEGTGMVEDRLEMGGKVQPKP